MLGEMIYGTDVEHQGSPEREEAAFLGLTCITSCT